MPIEIKSAREVELMTEAGRILEIVHNELGKALHPGMSTLEIDRLGEEIIRSYGCTPSFFNYNGYPASICVSVNEEVVHGIPSSKRILKEGDIVSLDAGVIYKGYHSDAARTHGIGEISKEAEQNLHERMEANDVRGDKNTAKEKNARTGDNTTEEKNIRTGEDTAEERPTVTGEQTAPGEAAIKRNVGTDSAERIPVQKQRRSVQEVPAQAPVMVSEELPPPMAEQMQINGVKEDKWEQILDTYDQIHPYGDERVYVKLEPKDFVILQEKYQQLVNNSFLLHGFYNYRYVILGKENDYYLGVPGVFYEREKMVALMFGFEAFECSGGEARPGEFGYYLRMVEL